MSVIGSDDKGNDQIEWPEWVGEDLRNPENRALAKYKTAEEVAKGYVNLSRKIGQAIFKPGEGASEAQIQAWNKAIGVPEKPDGYGLNPEELQGLAPETVGLIQESAFKHGLPAGGLKSVLSEVAAKSKAQMDAMVEEVKKRETAYEEAIKKAAGADYEEMAKRATEQFKNDPELDDYAKEVLKNTGLLSHPWVVKSLDARAQNGKGGFEKPGPKGAPDINDIQAEINKLARTPEYMGRQHPDHAKAMARMEELVMTKLDMKAE